MIARLSQELEPALGVACGEQEFRLDVFQRNIHAMRYVQPDVHYVGDSEKLLVYQYPTGLVYREYT